MMRRRSNPDESQPVVFRARVFRTLQATAILWVVATAGACTFEGDIGGCGTEGAMGKVSFGFEDLWLVDMAAESGRAFAAGTHSRFNVSDLTDEGLEPFTVVSSDPSVVAIRQEPQVEGAYNPWEWRADFVRAGTAKIEVRSIADQELLDWVRLRVAQPEFLELTVGPEISPQWDGGGVTQEPARVVVRQGSMFRLFVRLLGPGGEPLFGSFSPTIRTPAAGLGVVEGEMVGLGSRASSIYAMLGIVASDAVEASLEITGPGGLTRQLPVLVSTHSAAVDSLQVFFYPEDPTDVRVGQRLTLVAVGNRGQREPVYGFAVDFFSANESVARIVPSGEPDWCLVDFRAIGTALVGARLPGNPSVQAIVSVAVKPPDAD